MTTGDLRSRATAYGVDVTYWDWQGRETSVGDETLAAILAAIGDVPEPASPPLGGQSRAAAAVPDQRAWGFTVQLYSLRSRASWGHGDLRDLADLARWSARDLGADFVLINPLHAAEPLAPVSPSPYLPMSRRFISPLYLRIEDILEYKSLTGAQRSVISELAAPLHVASTRPGLIDRDAVWTAKRAALEIIRKIPLSAGRQESLDTFKARHGRALRDWAAWCALAEVHGPDYRAWPAALHDPRSAEVAIARADLARPAEFHAWVQWLVAEQVAATQQAAKDAGMTIGVVCDLAVGSHPGGADAWAGQDTLVRGISVGAPPDGFNQRGQDWTLPPWHPGHLAAQGSRPVGDLIGAVLGPPGAGSQAGGIRMDHVMGLSRLWWIPQGMPADRGAYVHYHAQASLDVVAAQARGAGAIVVGEDLGTVEPWLRDVLSEHGVLGTSMLWFERGLSNEPLAPQWWRRNALVTVSTHDMPPAAAFLTGEQVTERANLGLLTRSLQEEKNDAERLVNDWLGALAAHGLLPAAEGPKAEEFTAALYGYLARTPALLIGVSLAEAVGERRSQNMPGTTDEYPNWRIPLCGPTGNPILVEDLPNNPVLHAVVGAVCKDQP